MDEHEYRRIAGDAVTLPCAFDRVLLQRRFPCARARKTHIAERELVNCCDHACAARCAAVFDEVRRRGRFLEPYDETAPVSFAERVRFQLGAIEGIRERLGRPQDADVDALMRAAVDEWESIEAFPFSEIMRSVAAARTRPSRRRGKVGGGDR